MTTTLLDLLADVQRHGVRVEADADRGVLRLEGRACSALLADLRAHKPQLLAVLHRFQRMADHDAGHDRPPMPMAHWPAAYGPGSCQSCGQVLDHPRAVGRCSPCDIAAELLYRARRGQGGRQ